MAMNPGNLFKLLDLQKKFNGNHPKFARFVETVLLAGLPEGTVVDIRVTKPGEETIESNMRVTEDDLAMAEELKNLAGKK